MNFKTLKDRMEYFRSLTDYKLTPNSYVLVMLDGRSFSKMVKNKFEKPFDDTFIDMMNETAKYVCNNVQGCKMAYTQSDEISLIITDFDTPTTDAFFGYRLCKLQSLIASMATAKFNQLIANIKWSQDGTIFNPLDMPLYEFDCKAWNVPTENDAFAWVLYRQNDCVRNSKQQAAQTYLSHKELMNKHTDKQIVLLKEKHGIDWNEYDDGKKYGRFIYKAPVLQPLNDNGEYTIRYKWGIFNAFPLNSDEGKERFFSMNILPKI